MEQRPDKIEWKPCPCGSPHCDRKYPANLGMFHVGNGFEPHEVEWLDAAWDALNQSEGKSC